MTMGLHVALVAVVFMLGLVGPLIGATWYSVRSEHHTPAALRDGDPGPANGE